MSNSKLRHRLLLAVVGAGCLISIWSRFSVSSSLWLDEALTVNIAQLPLSEIADALRHDGAPPLYYWILHLWMEIFGTGDVAVRSLSAVFGLAAAGVAYPVAARRAGRSGGLTAMVLLLVLPFAVRYGSEARMYSLLMLLVLGGVLAVDKYLDGGSLVLLGIPVLSGALALTHYWGIWTMAVGTLFFLYRWVLGGSEIRNRQQWRNLTLATAAGGLLFLPWLSTFLFQAERTGTPWAEPTSPQAGVPIAVVDWAGGANSVSYWLGWLLLFLVVVGIFGNLTTEGQLQLRIRPDCRWLPFAILGFGALLLGLTLAYLGESAFQGRYSAAVFPSIALLITGGIRKLPTTFSRTGTLALVVLLSSVGAVRNTREDRTQAGQVGAAIAQEVANGDHIVVCPDQIGPSLRRVLGDREVTFHAFPEGAGVLIDWVDYEQRNRAADPKEFLDPILANAQGKTIWFATSFAYRTFEGKCEALEGLLTAARPNVRALVSADDAIFEFYGLKAFGP